MWAGVDVGGLKKGFHASVVDNRRLVLGTARLRSTTEAAAWIRASGTSLMAVDSPKTCAPVSDHETARSSCVVPNEASGHEGLRARGR